MQFNFGYQVATSAINSSEADQFSGSYRFVARVSDPNGWNRLIPLTPVTEFQGIDFTKSMNLDLCFVRAMIVEMEEKTGTKNNWYSLSIHPEIEVSGEISGRQISEKFTPQVDFEVSELLMRLPNNDDGAANKGYLAFSKQGTLPASKTVVNTLNLFGLVIPVTTVRMLSSTILGACFIGILWMGWPLYQEWKRGDASRIRVQYETMLVDVQPGSISPNGHAVPVDSFDDLAKLAERYGAMILCETTGDLNKYWVQDGDVLYEYALKQDVQSQVLVGEGSPRQAISDAVSSDEFQLFFQPIVSTLDGKIEAFEALLRWFHPENGVIYPAEFIDQAEEQGMLVLIDKEACKNNFPF